MRHYFVCNGTKDHGQELGFSIEYNHTVCLEPLLSTVVELSFLPALSSRSCRGKAHAWGLSWHKTAGGGTLKRTGGHYRMSNSFHVGSKSGLPVLNENKNVRDNCLKMPSPDENHQFHQVVGCLGLPFSHNMGSPAKSLLMD